MSSLARRVLLWIGDKAAGEVTSADLHFVLRRIWHNRPESARSVRQRIHAVEVAASPAVKLAFEFLVLTAPRSGEVRGAVNFARHRSTSSQLRT